MVMHIERINIHNTIKNQERIVACIGFFDGLHLGHQELIKKTVELANQYELIPALITFDPDPWVVIKMVNDIPHITPMNKRIEVAKQYGIKKWIILEFDKDMCKLDVDAFHDLILNPLNIHTLVCGYDFHYGNKGKGNIDTLKAQDDFKVEVIKQISSEDEKISSTRIEKCLLSGDVETCFKLLGRYYEIDGVVVHGNELGRLYGFPTANLKLNDNYIIPLQGVYIASVKVKNKWYPAIINIGHNPSFNYQQNTSIEAYIINFDQMIYGEQVTYRFHQFLRKEQKFNGMDELKAELQRNTLSALAYFDIRKELLENEIKSI